MSAKPISSHVAEVLSQLEKVQTLTRDQRIQFGHDLLITLYGPCSAGRIPSIRCTRRRTV